MSAAATESKVTLPVAALSLGLSYERARRLLLNGTLTGEQVAGRLWLVDLESVERVKQELDA
jgi:hypothetical protein